MSDLRHRFDLVELAGGFATYERDGELIRVNLDECQLPPDLSDKPRRVMRCIWLVISETDPLEHLDERKERDID